MNDNIKLEIELPVLELDSDRDTIVYINPYTIEYKKVDYTVFDLTLIKINNKLYPDWVGREGVETFISRIDRKRKLPHRGTLWCCVGIALPSQGTWDSKGPWNTPVLMFLENKPDMDIRDDRWYEAQVNKENNMLQIGRTVDVPYVGIFKKSEEKDISQRQYVHNFDKLKRKPSEEMIRVIYGPKYDLFKG